MVEYKLIKKYPGSPNIGDKAIYNEDANNFRINNNYHQPLPIDKIIKYPEFWEKQDAEDWIAKNNPTKKEYSIHTIIDNIECCRNRFSSTGGEFIQVDELIHRLKDDKT